jgi:hypothetical protein
MTDTGKRRAVAGGRIDDLCRACKMVRPHTVLAAAGGVAVRVVCDWCGSQHNYRGGGVAAETRSGAGGATGGALPLVSERERSARPMSDPTTGNTGDLELLLRRVIREESGLTPVAPAEKWRDGELVLRPGRPGLQEKIWPIETFFHKVVMVRNRLRTLEQQVNASDLPADVKVRLQGYVTACYGSLTSFNVLFGDDADRFHGSGE